MNGIGALKRIKNGRRIQNSNSYRQYYFIIHDAIVFISLAALVFRTLWFYVFELENLLNYSHIIVFICLLCCCSQLSSLCSPKKMILINPLRITQTGRISRNKKGEKGRDLTENNHHHQFSQSFFGFEVALLMNEHAERKPTTCSVSIVLFLIFSLHFFTSLDDCRCAVSNTSAHSYCRRRLDCQDFFSFCDCHLVNSVRIIVADSMGEYVCVCVE